MKIILNQIKRWDHKCKKNKNKNISTDTYWFQTAWHFELSVGPGHPAMPSRHPSGINKFSYVELRLLLSQRIWKPWVRSVDYELLGCNQVTDWTQMLLSHFWSEVLKLNKQSSRSLLQSPPSETALFLLQQEESKVALVMVFRQYCNIFFSPLH